MILGTLHTHKIGYQWDLLIVRAGGTPIYARGVDLGFLHSCLNRERTALKVRESDS